jgi:hypothetical protein
MPLQILAARQEARWDSDNVPPHRSLIGKTVGLLVSVQYRLTPSPTPSSGLVYPTSVQPILSAFPETGCRRSSRLKGYGHIARETARLLKVFNCEIIAANSSGKRGTDTGVSCSPPHSPPSPFHWIRPGRCDSAYHLAVCHTWNRRRSRLNTV